MTLGRSSIRLAAMLMVPLLLAACSSSGATATPGAPAAQAGYPAGCPTSQPAALAADATRTVTIATPKGTIVIAIKGSLSPIATGNFVALASCGYYDNVVFQRLVPGFVIQGGDGQYGRLPNLDTSRVGRGGPPYKIQDEPVTAQYARGVVAMARSSLPNSVSSQFFIVLDNAAEPALSSANTYQIVGTVTSGMDTVDAIASMPSSGDPAYAAIDPVPMTKVTVATP